MFVLGLFLLGACVCEAYLPRMRSLVMRDYPQPDVFNTVDLTSHTVYHLNLA